APGGSGHATGSPRRMRESGRQIQHPGRLEPAARSAGPKPHGGTLTTFIDQTNLTRPRVELEPDATAADLATLELEASSDGLELESIAITDATKAPASPAVPTA